MKTKVQMKIHVFQLKIKSYPFIKTTLTANNPNLSLYFFLIQICFTFIFYTYFQGFFSLFCYLLQFNHLCVFKTSKNQKQKMEIQMKKITKNRRKKINENQNMLIKSVAMQQKPTKQTDKNRTNKKM